MKKTDPAPMTVTRRRSVPRLLQNTPEMRPFGEAISRALRDWQNRHLKKLNKKDTDDAI